MALECFFGVQMDFGFNFFIRNGLSFEFKSGQDFRLLVCAYLFCIQSSEIDP